MTDPFEGYPRQPPAEQRYLVFDGRTVTLRYDPPPSPPAGGCVGGELGDVQAGIRRFEARRSGDELEARLPCVGWARIGRFRGRDRLHLLRPARTLRAVYLQRLPMCVRDRYLLCRPVYDGSGPVQGECMGPDDCRALDDAR
jgi:hypothetical protein